MSHLTTEQIIKAATGKADQEAETAAATAPKSNGSEAWQAVVIDVDGRSKVAKELKALGIDKDGYYGFTVSARGLSNYYAEEAWTTTFAGMLNLHGIKARRVERLL